MSSWHIISQLPTQGLPWGSGYHCTPRPDAAARRSSADWRGTSPKVATARSMARLHSWTPSSCDATQRSATLVRRFGEQHSVTKYACPACPPARRPACPPARRSACPPARQPASRLLQLPNTPIRHAPTARLNEHLPADVRVFAVSRVSKSFSARSACTWREYHYLLPLDQHTGGTAGAGTQAGSTVEVSPLWPALCEERFGAALAAFEGTNCFVASRAGGGRPDRQAHARTHARTHEQAGGPKRTGGRETGRAEGRAHGRTGAREGASPPDRRDAIVPRPCALPPAAGCARLRTDLSPPSPPPAARRSRTSG